MSSQCESERSGLGEKRNKLTNWIQINKLNRFGLPASQSASQSARYRAAEEAACAAGAIAFASCCCFAAPRASPQSSYGDGALALCESPRRRARQLPCCFPLPANKSSRTSCCALGSKSNRADSRRPAAQPFSSERVAKKWAGADNSNTEQRRLTEALACET